MFLEKEKGLVDVEDEVAPVEAVGRLVRGRVLVGNAGFLLREFDAVFGVRLRFVAGSRDLARN